MASPAQTSDKVPSQQDVAQAKGCTVIDWEGGKHTFGSLLSTDQGGVDVILFVRHYHCGACLSYLQSFFSHPDSARANVLVIGHGDHTLIKGYQEKVKAGVSSSSSTPAIRVYSDPTKHLYHSLGFTRRNLQLSKDAPSYYGQGRGHGSMIFSSVVDMVKGLPGSLWKSGDFAQLGGEIMLKGGGEEVVYAHYMENTTDHTDVEVLMGKMREAGEAGGKASS